MITRSKFDFRAFFVILSLAARLSAMDSSDVRLIRTPNNGIQPQASVDNQGVVHLIYFKGDAGAGDIFYTFQRPADDTFSAPIRVNSMPGSAMAVGSIRGAQMAIGRNGRVHVAWNGHAPDKGSFLQAPMLYTRLNDMGTAFEPERNVITWAGGLDGGGSVAANSKGNVFVMWHAPKPANTNGEAGRAVFVARSTDDGKTFSPEKLATEKPTGACGCCGMKAFGDDEGHVFALYRAASEMVYRSETLLASRNEGATFEVIFTHPWKIASCPMSSASFSVARNGLLGTWESDGRVYFTRITPDTMAISEPISPPGTTQRKHPVAIGNARGEVLLAWTEGTGWARGGSVAWQVFDKEGKPTGKNGRADGVPVWSLVTAFPKPDGSFAIVY